MMFHPQVVFTSEKSWENNDVLTIKISKDTAFMFLNDSNVCTIYPEYLSKEELADELASWCNGFSKELLADAAKWIKSQMI